MYKYNNKEGDGTNIANALFAIANELLRRNDIEEIDRIRFGGENDDKYLGYIAEQER